MTLCIFALFRNFNQANTQKVYITKIIYCVRLVKKKQFAPCTLLMRGGLTSHGCQPAPPSPDAFHTFRTTRSTYSWFSSEKSDKQTTAPLRFLNFSIRLQSLPGNKGHYTIFSLQQIILKLGRSFLLYSQCSTSSHPHSPGTPGLPTTGATCSVHGSGQVLVCLVSTHSPEQATLNALSAKLQFPRSCLFP